MKTKLLSLLLALAMALSFTTVFAAEEPDPSPPASEEVPAEEAAPTDPEIEKTDLKKQIVPREEVPALIDYDLAVAEKYVCRAYWEETSLNEVVFLKSDGALARHIFSFPVKYEADGEVYDKKPELLARETLLANKYRYELSAQNDTVLYCGENVADGFFFQGEDLQVNLRPITKDEYDFLRGHIDAGAIVAPISLIGGTSTSPLVGYDSVAVTGTAQSALTEEEMATTAALYALSTTGQQASFAALQDTLAVVPSYTGFQLQLALAQGELATTLYFELDPKGLLLARPSDTLLLFDKEGNTVGIVGDLLSDRGMAHDVNYSVTPLDNGNYLLAATLPRSASISTYSTSITLDYDDLEDATICNSANQNDASYPNSATLWVGYYGYSGFERVLIHPANWSLTSSSVPNQVITRATITLRDITVTSPEAIIECRQFTGNAWDENTATWNLVNGDSVGPVCDENAVSSAIGWTEGYYYDFDITGLVQNWYQGTVNPQKGVIFIWKNGTETNMEKGFASTEHSTEAYRPRLVVEYAATQTVADGVYYLHSAAGGVLTATESCLENSNVYQRTSKQGASDADRMNQLWRVVHVQNGYYTIRPYHYTPSGLSASGRTVDSSGNYSYNTNAVFCNIGISDIDIDVPSYGLWRISEYTTSTVTGVQQYSLSLFGTGWELENYTGGTDFGNITVCDGYGGNEHRWTMEEVSVFVRAVRFYNNGTGNVETTPVKDVSSGQLVTLHSLGLSVSICVPIGKSINPLEYTWKSDNNGIVTVSSSVPSFVAVGIGYTFVTMIWENGVPSETYCWFRSRGEGAYYIRNGASEKYVDIENQSISNGATLQQEDFRASPTSKWEFVKHENGYYTIHPVTNLDYYFAVQQETAGVYEVVLSCGELSEVSYWQLTAVGNKRFTIATKMDHTKVLSLDISDNEQITDSGVGIHLDTYVSDLDCSDEWFITDAAYFFNLYSYYDQAYENLHGVDVKDRIQSELSEVSVFLKDLFGIRLNIQLLKKETTYMDNCDEVDLGLNCTNSAHSLTYSDGRVVYCTDYDKFFSLYCTEYQYIPCTEGFLYFLGYEFGVDATAGNVTLVSGAFGTSHLLLHEIAHQLGAPDHYCVDPCFGEENHDSNCNKCEHAARCNNPNHQPSDGEEKKEREGHCIMDNDGSNGDLRWASLAEAIGNSDIGMEKIFCADCKADIFSHLEETGHMVR